MAFVQIDDFNPGTDLARVVASRKILEAMTRGRIASFSIQAAGTGYAVGDLLTLTPGTSTHPARFIVTAVGGSGEVTGLEFRSAGVYTVLPDSSTTGHATTTDGAGTGCTLNTVSEAAFEADPDAGGSGYVVGDVITVTGGTGGTTDPTFVVTAVSSGAVTELKPLDIGDRTDPVDTSVSSTSTTGGSGTGLTVFYNQIHWLELDSDYSDDATDFTWYARGVNASGTGPVVALQTLNVNGTAPAIDIRVATNYDPAEGFHTQPGSWLDGQPTGSNRLVRISTTDTDPFSLFLYISGRVVNFVFTDDTSYQLGVMGAFIPFTDAPATTFNAPFVAGGTACNSGGTIDITSPFTPRGTFSNDARNNNSSILHAMSGSSNESEVAPYRCTNEIVEWKEIVSDSGFTDTVRLWPWSGFADLGNFVEAPSLDTDDTPNTASGNVALLDGRGPLGQSPFGDTTTGDGTPGPAPLGTSGQLHFMGPPTLIIDSAAGPKILGQLEGLALINGRGLNAEDRVEDTVGRRWFVFPDTVTNEDRGFCAMLEG